MRLSWKDLVTGGMGLLALLGLATAINNLPVRTGCSFYGTCPSDADRENRTIAPALSEGDQ